MTARALLDSGLRAIARALPGPRGSPVALLLALLASLPALALDPRFVWQTIETPHFQVHYHQGQYKLAQKFARSAEEAHRRLVPLLDHAPSGRTQLVVEDDTDFANGNATPLLYNLIHAYAAPPDSRSTLNDFDDNVSELISHEYTHILHLDTVLGLPEVTNSVFGKLWIPNGGQPSWFIEGMAVFTESEITGAGRVRSAQEEMTVRAQVLENRFWRIDQLSSSQLDWPRGFGQYTVGGRFVNWLAGQYGLGALRDISHDFGGRAIPLGMNLSAERVLGTSYLDLYQQYRESEVTRARAVEKAVKAEGESRIEHLTRLGEWIRTPRWSPDGSTLYYIHSGPDRMPEIRAVQPDRCCDALARQDGPVRQGDHAIATLYSDPYGDDTLAVDRSGRVTYARIEVFQQFEDLQDLYAIDPRTGDTERLTRGMRAREQDVAADGSIAFLWRRTGGRTAIAELAPGATEPRVLFEDPDGEPVGGPRYSPSGKQVAFLHHRDGSWDVRIVAREGGALTDVTRDRAIDRDPSWTPDGKYVLFSSDRSGVYNIYAWRVTDGALLKVSNVLFGAFDPEPSPDGAQLALVTYSSRGYDLGRMALVPDNWKPVTAPPVAEARPPVGTLPPEEVFPVHAYSPWSTLRPYFWLPYANTDALGSTLGALTQGFDAVGRHEYAATAWYGLGSHLPGWDLTYVNHSLYPDITLSTARDLSGVAGGGRYYTEREVGGLIAASFPFSQIERGQAITVQYSATSLATHTNPENRRIPSGLLTVATFQYSYSDARRFVNAISAEQGQRFSLTLRIADPLLGGDFAYQQLSSAYSHYFRMPWSWDQRPLHHALAVRGSFGISHGDLSRRHLYGLGGFDLGDPVRAVLNPTTAPSRILRGFVQSAFAGEAYALGTIEYRFPLLTIQAGPWTLPFFFRRLHGAAFADIGDAFTARNGALLESPADAPADGPPRKARPHVGLGAELRAEIVLGYILPTDFRLGCARGAENSPLAILDCYAALGGVF